MWIGTLKEAPWYETWLPLSMMMDVSMQHLASPANLDTGVNDVMCGASDDEDVGSIAKDGAYQVHGALTAYTWLLIVNVRLGLMSLRS
jgi:hypothetical protein